MVINVQSLKKLIKGENQMHPSDLLFRKIEQRPISIPKMIIFIRIGIVLFIT